MPRQAAGLLPTLPDHHSVASPHPIWVKYPLQQGAAGLGTIPRWPRALPAPRAHGHQARSLNKSTNQRTARVSSAVGFPRGFSSSPRAHGRLICWASPSHLPGPVVSPGTAPAPRHGQPTSAGDLPEHGSTRPVSASRRAEHGGCSLRF